MARFYEFPQHLCVNNSAKILHVTGYRTSTVCVLGQKPSFIYIFLSIKTAMIIVYHSVPIMKNRVSINMLDIEEEEMAWQLRVYIVLT